MVKTAISRSAEALETETGELVENGVILHPDLPAAPLAEILLEEAEPGLLRELGRALTIRHLIRAIRAERLRGRKPIESAPLFAGLNHLPRTITLDGKRRVFAKANRTQLRAYLTSLHARHKDRIADIEAVLKLMEQYAAGERNVNVAAVAARVAGE
jgi:hypothetical protein